MRISEQEYLDGLEEERRKIQVFHRELPLCLDLVNQAIERCRRQLQSYSERSTEEHGEDEELEEETSSGEGPVLEEFIPLKRITAVSAATTSSISECEHYQSESVDRSGDNNLGNKVDWLRSVQLWTNNHNQTSTSDSPNQDSRKSSVIEPPKKMNGGAFHPFRKEKSESAATTTTTITTTTAAATATTATANAVAARPAMVPTAAASSTADNGGNKSGGEDRQNKGQQANKKARRCWSPELHRRFLQALQQLGGSHAATPKQIRELMKVDGLTNDEVKSHLQKYRLHTRRSPGPQHSNGTTTSQPPQFVVVGGIWVPPPEYSTVPTSKGETPLPCSKGIYVPVATAPQLTLSPCSTQQQQKKQLLHRPQPIGLSHSSGRSSRAEHGVGHGGNDCRSSSQSPTTTCSSTDTTTASPAF
ncbi:hypothetical protein Syun_021616 [Stephania yunnanensis]|uniref:HTH myb-type domain-containing protein n=1 Tax=Stephania yunnanensis TaxID=152371 RepID=A0AAP0NQU3_9MAGN